jgi:hypothetical protein
MSSVLRFLKQTPVDTQYFISLRDDQGLNIFTPDAAASTTSYVSGAAAGRFTTSNVTGLVGGASFDPSGQSGPVLFRDMGKTIVSSGRTFRRVQLLSLDGNGGTGWSSTTGGTPGVWQAGNEGVVGNPNTANTADTSFGVFYFETGARGLGLAQGLIRYG